MTKKLTLDQFVSRAEDVHGARFDYSRVTYLASYKSVEIICPKHGPFFQTPSNHLKGKGCPHCAGVARSTTSMFVEKAIEKHGDKYDYSGVSYCSNSKPVEILCKTHGPFLQTPSSHLQGKGCPACGGTKPSNTTLFKASAQKVHGDKYDYSQVVYKNNRQKVRIVCPTHGSFEQAPSNHLAGKGCPVCAGNTLLDTAKFIEKAVSVHGHRYDYSKVVYARSNKKVEIVCPEHGSFFQTPNNHLSGHGCFTCNQVGVQPYSHDDFLAKARLVHGDTFDYSGTNYTRSWEHVSISCKVHGPFLQMPEKHLVGQGCPVCALSGPSKAQLEIDAFLTRHALVQSEEPIPGTNYRLDMYLPEHALAVEYHGLIWHSTKFLSDPRKDYKRHVLAQKIGVRVIHIYEDEWAKKKAVVERLLLAAVKKLPRIHARQTTIVSVSKEDANAFYESNHLQGGRQARVNLGLVHEGGLVACMSFDMLRSVRKNADTTHWELVRYAAAMAVVGGPSKLFAAFAKLGLARRVTSYSDNRCFNGAMYAALGFTKVHETEPDYTYTNGRVSFGRKHKSAYQKKHLAKMFPESDLSKTEWEICEANGLYRIYDCGKSRWDITLPSCGSETALPDPERSIHPD